MTDLVLICDAQPDKWLLHVPGPISPELAERYHRAAVAWLESPSSRVIIMEQGARLTPPAVGRGTIGAEFCAA